MGQKKKNNNEAVAAAVAAPAALPARAAPAGIVNKMDIAALLNAKIQQFEQSSKEDQQKSQQAQKGRARASAKGKLKEAKTMVTSKEASDEEKIAWLLSKLEEEHKEADVLVKEADSRREAIGDAEKEQANCQNELAQEVGVKGKLEQLCRKLQQQKDALLEDRRRLTDQERTRRQEMADEFQSTINNVKKTMDQHAQERTRLHCEHEALLERKKQVLKSCDMHELAERQLNADRSEQTKLVDERQGQLAQLYKQEETKKIHALRENQELLEADEMLKSQLNTYTTKFKQFQEALSKSDKVLGQYKREKTKMERKVQNLEPENAALKTKSERKRTQLERDRDQAVQELNKLKERSKTLQAERQQLQEQKM